MLNLKDLPNPKRTRTAALGRSGWYPYYAGFSSDFADAAVRRFCDKRESKILDSWNGSGTTTASIAGAGNEGFGFDLNPAMVIVARARLLNKRERPSLTPLAKAIIESKGNATLPKEDDPLRLWFTKSSTANIRSIDWGIQRLLIGNRIWQPMSKHINSIQFSDLTAFFYIALFRTVRSVLAPFRSSNPTWLKIPKNEANKLNLRMDILRSEFLQQIALMEQSLDHDNFSKDGKVEIRVASSEALPIQDQSIDFVLSSPPYCTRIDYAAATRIELSILGVDAGESFENLRRTLLGSSTVPKVAPTVSPNWGQTCTKLLQDIQEHPSKASTTYYYKSHCQYFDGIYKSLNELSRCLKTAGIACIVVQDSYYKNIHNDLATIYEEMASNLGMRPAGRRNFVSHRNMAQVNSKSREYRGANATATETILALVK